MNEQFCVSYSCSPVTQWWGQSRNMQYESNTSITHHLFGYMVACTLLEVVQYQQHAVRVWEQAPVDKNGAKNLEATSGSMNHSLVAKLNRTDTTLDLSQKAEKGMPKQWPLPGYIDPLHDSMHGCAGYKWQHATWDADT